jgi:2-polyprenyl-6-hydroxyphenyl methylase/3-demethylubiquinone-9 3-methyltransferase
MSGGWAAMRDGAVGCEYRSSGYSCAHAYLLPAVERIVAAKKPERIFDLGCGNGVVANRLSSYAPVTGIDISASGVQIARENFPHLNIHVGSAYDDLARQYGTFPIVVSLEVVEHLFDPRTYAKRLFGLVEAGGIAVISTPYHGYWKNLALALTGRFDTHFSVLWDGGHIKFWSMRTLGLILKEAGFCQVEFLRVGRIPALAKSMIAIAHKPL